MIQSILKGFKVLEVIAAAPEKPHTIAEVAAALSLPVPTCGRIMQTLEAANYVEQRPPRGGFVLGPQAYRLASRGQYRRDLVLAAQSAMEESAAELRETIILAVLRNGVRTMLMKVEGRQAVQVRSEIFERNDIYETATGRLLLAWLTGKEQEVVLKRYGWPDARWDGILSKSRWERALADVRAKERVEIQHDTGVVHLAVPVRDGEQVVAAVGIFMPRERYRGNHKTAVLDGLDRLGRSISTSLRQSSAKTAEKT